MCKKIIIIIVTIIDATKRHENDTQNKTMTMTDLKKYIRTICQIETIGSEANYYIRLKSRKQKNYHPLPSPSPGIY